MKYSMPPSRVEFIKHGGSAINMAARHTGTVSHIDEADGFGEITVPGHGPIVCSLRDLIAIDAAQIGAAVDFEFGAIPPWRWGRG